MNTFNYKVNDEIIIITNVALYCIYMYYMLHLLIFKLEENHITHKIMWILFMFLIQIKQK